MTPAETVKVIIQKLEEINKHLQEIDKTLIKQEANLEKHMIRTEQNETMIQIISGDLKPVKKHVTQVEGVFKFLGLVSLVLGIIYVFIKLIQG